MATETEIFGRGFAFPFQFDANTGGVKKRKGLESVEDAFIFILGTYRGERFMFPTFGSRINQVLFELDEPGLRALIHTYIAEAVALEPRIDTITNVRVDADTAIAHGLLVTVQYRPIHQMDSRNLVLPLIRG